jgi:hypothetical protein
MVDLERTNPNKYVRTAIALWLILATCGAMAMVMFTSGANLVIGLALAIIAVFAPVRFLADFPVFYTDEMGKVYIRRYFKPKLLIKDLVEEKEKLSFPIYVFFAPDGYSVTYENKNGREDTFYILGDKKPDDAREVYDSI